MSMFLIIACLAEFAIAMASLGGDGGGAWVGEFWADYRCDVW